MYIVWATTRNHDLNCCDLTSMQVFITGSRPFQLLSILQHELKVEFLYYFAYTYTYTYTYNGTQNFIFYWVLFTYNINQNT